MSASCFFTSVIVVVILSTDQKVAACVEYEDPMMPTDPNYTAFRASVEERLWSVEPITAPLVDAMMTFDYTLGNRSKKFYDKTYNIGVFKRLFIPLNSTLYLFCKAYNPIEWTKNGEPIINNAENVLQFSDLPKEESGIKKEKYFRKRLEITNVTFETEGQYACIASVPDLNITIDESLQTDFEVIVEGPEITDQMLEPRILTPVYDEVYHGCTNFYGLTTMFTVIAPLGMDYKEYFTFPQNVTLQLSDYVYRKLPNGITFSSSRHSSSMTIGTWGRTLSLDPPRSDNKYELSGTFTYVVQYKAADGSWLNISRQVTVTPEEDVSRQEQFAEITAWDTFRVHLSRGRYYKLIYHGDIIPGTVEAHGQSSTSCDLIDFTADSQYDACGVLDMRTKDERRTEISGDKFDVILRKSFHIRLKVVRSCAFRMQIWSVDRHQSITRTIYVKAVEMAYKPMPGENGVSFVTSDGVQQDSSKKYTNEAITIQCRFPACGWEIIALCKEGLWMDCVRLIRENNTYVSFSTRFSRRNSNLQNVSFVPLSNLTFALEVRLGKLELYHAGVYGCGELQSTSYTRDEYYSNEKMAFYEAWRRIHFSNFHLAVNESKMPNFTDGQSTFQEIIMNNGEAILNCPFTGSPAPSITWTKNSVYKESGRDIVRQGEMYAYRNKTSVTVQGIGTYECIAKNRFGESKRAFNVKRESVSSPLPIAFSVTAAAVLLTFTIATVLWQRRRAKKAMFKGLAQLLSEPRDGVQLDDVLPLNDQTDILPYNTNYEIDRDRFQLIKVIGDGEFGQVFRGELQTSKNQRRYVAVKVPKNPLKPEHHQALISELKIMIYLRPHVNVLALIGACTNELQQRQQLFVLTEYCEKGSLLSYLQDHILDYEGQATGFGIQSLLDFAYQAANGMEHLAAWRIIHRDLAVRNLLLTHRGVIKIADFGLSRQKETIYSYNKFLFRNVRLPVPWMAPESVTRFEYTHKSDVWSFGVVLWEMFSCGRVPYASVDISGMDIILWLREGNRLSMPILATNDMYSLMLDCWASDPTNRPTFSQCKGRIARHLEAKFPSSYTSLLLLLSDSFCQMGAVRQASSSTINQETLISSGEVQQEETAITKMEGCSLVNLSGDSCSLSTPASFEYVTSVGTSEAGGEINAAFEDEKPGNGYVTSGDDVLSVDSVFEQELSEQQGTHDDAPLLG